MSTQLFPLPGSEAPEWFVYSHLGRPGSRLCDERRGRVHSPLRPRAKLCWKRTPIEQEGFYLKQKIRQDTYLKIKDSWQTGSMSLFVWTCLAVGRGKEWLLKSLGGCEMTPVQLTHAGRFITLSVYSVALKSLCFWDLESLFSICQEVLFSSQVWCSLPREKDYS